MDKAFSLSSYASWKQLIVDQLQLFKWSFLKYYVNTYVWFKIKSVELSEQLRVFVLGPLASPPTPPSKDERHIKSQAPPSPPPWCFGRATSSTWMVILESCFEIIGDVFEH